MLGCSHNCVERMCLNEFLPGVCGECAVRRKRRRRIGVEGAGNGTILLSCRGVGCIAMLWTIYKAVVGLICRAWMMKKSALIKQ